MERGDLANRFAYHAPDGEKVVKHGAMRAAFHDLAQQIDANVPDSREKSLAITALEEGLFWTNAGIARMDENGERL